MVSVWVIALLVLHSLYWFDVVPNMYDPNHLWILRKKHFGVLLTILTMWFEFFIYFSCSFKFLITILSFYCVFVHPCWICSSYIRFVFCFWRLLFEVSLGISCLFNILITILLTCWSFFIDVYVSIRYFHNVFHSVWDFVVYFFDSFLQCSCLFNILITIFVDLLQICHRCLH
jgi:hypothetical protein